ncbi:MAG: transglutaminase family protein [Rhodobacterales bacterium]|nr:transglutaminase family protein [Rhodobacterales bacterium]
MRLTVDHVTRYVYDRPVRSLVQSHRLQPSVFAGQKVVDWSVTVSGGQKGAAHKDGAGDLVQGWTVAGPVSEIVVAVRGTVETVDLTGVLRGFKEIVAPDCYLRGTTPTRADANLAALAATADGATPLDLAHSLSAVVADAITYKPGVTHAHTTAAEALALGVGVCQDHAHAMIAVARVRGIAGRYVSGYLFSDSDGQAHEAAHAWAELHLPGLGWVGFDPANRTCPDDRYIRLGSGFDAQDAAPIRGIARGGGKEEMDVTVAILQAAQ